MLGIVVSAGDGSAQVVRVLAELPAFILHIKRVMDIGHRLACLQNDYHGFMSVSRETVGASVVAQGQSVRPKREPTRRILPDHIGGHFRSFRLFQSFRRLRLLLLFLFLLLAVEENSRHAHYDEEDGDHGQVVIRFAQIHSSSIHP